MSSKPEMRVLVLLVQAPSRSEPSFVKLGPRTADSGRKGNLLARDFFERGNFGENQIFAFVRIVFGLREFVLKLSVTSSLELGIKPT